MNNVDDDDYLHEINKSKCALLFPLQAVQCEHYGSTNKENKTQQAGQPGIAVLHEEWVGCEETGLVFTHTWTLCTSAK